LIAALGVTVAACASQGRVILGISRCGFALATKLRYSRMIY